MKLTDMPSFKREESKQHMENIINSFLNYFVDLSYILHEPVKIHSGIDPSVHFIGAHISVLKNYLVNNNVPEQGIVISQPCVRTQNLRKYEDESYVSNWGSFFRSLGVLVSPKKLEEATNQTFNLLKNEWGIKEDNIIIRVSERDEDLIKLAKDSVAQKFLEIDTMPLVYYRHKFGLNNIFGRNFNIALKHYETGIPADIGNVIIIQNEQNPVGIEIALGTSTILKQIHGLTHILNSHPLMGTEIINNKSTRLKLEDCIITSLHLYYQGLEPSNKHITNRLMKKYVDIIGLILKNEKIPITYFETLLEEYEVAEFGANRHSQNILSYLSRNDSKNI